MSAWADTRARARPAVADEQIWVINTRPRNANVTHVGWFTSINISKEAEGTLFTKRKCAGGWHRVASSLFVAATLSAFSLSYFLILKFSTQITTKTFSAILKPHHESARRRDAYGRNVRAYLLRTMSARDVCEWMNDCFNFDYTPFPSTHFRPHYLIYFVSAVRINWNIYLMELE